MQLWAGAGVASHRCSKTGLYVRELYEGSQQRRSLERGYVISISQQVYRKAGTHFRRVYSYV